MNIHNEIHQKKLNTWEKLFENLLTMIPKYTPQYSAFTYNKTEDLFLQALQETEYSKNLYTIKNFPILSKEEFFISLKCIINNKKLKRPARTFDCRHVECLEAKILFNYIYKFGHCPLCGENNNINNESASKLGVDSIYIDKYLEEIFKYTEDDSNILFQTKAEFIIVNKHSLNWRPYSIYQNNQDTENMIYNTANDSRFDPNLNLKVDDHFKEMEDLNNYISKDENEIKISKLIDVFQELIMK